MKNNYILCSIISWILLSYQPVHAKDIQLNVIVPNPTYECWISGNFINWSLTDIKQCTKIDNTHYTVTLNDTTWAQGVSLSNLNYFYLNCKYDWTCCEKAKSGESLTSPRTYKSGVNDTIAKWDVYFQPSYFEINVNTPPETNECYLISDIFGWEPPSEMGKMTRVSTNEDGTVVFRIRLYEYRGSGISYQFCSGPGLDYIQSLPTDTFQLPEVFPTVKAWKKTFQTAVNTLTVSKIKIYVFGKKIFIDGLVKNEKVLICDFTGKLLKEYQSTGETSFDFQAEKGFYLVRVGNQAKSIIL